MVNGKRGARAVGMTTAPTLTFCLAALMVLGASRAGAQTLEELRKTRPWIEPTTRLAVSDGTLRLDDELPAGFTPDPSVLGEWRVVDLVTDAYRFLPNPQIWQETSFEVMGMVFSADGSARIDLQAGSRVDRWTAGHVLHDGEARTDSAYSLVDMSDEKYLFLQWKGDDYTYRFRKPPFLVLRKL
jgi:hypothetical protein